jgi:acyl carrier protein
MTAEEMETLLATLIRDIAGQDIDADTNFFEAGLTSAVLVQLHWQLVARLGTELPIAAAFRHPTRRQFARWLAGGPAPRQAPLTPPVADRSGADARRALRNRIRGTGR